MPVTGSNPVGRALRLLRQTGGFESLLLIGVQKEPNHLAFAQSDQARSRESVIGIPPPLLRPPNRVSTSTRPSPASRNSSGTLVSSSQVARKSRHRFPIASTPTVSLPSRRKPCLTSSVPSIGQSYRGVEGNPGLQHDASGDEWSPRHPGARWTGGAPLSPDPRPHPPGRSDEQGEAPARTDAARHSSARGRRRGRIQCEGDRSGEAMARRDRRAAAANPRTSSGALSQVGQACLNLQLD